MQAPKIRAATLSDVSVIKKIVENVYAHYIDRMGRKPAPMTDDYIAHVEAGQIWVLTANNDVAGLIVLRTRSDYLLINNVAVEKAYQGHGFGKKLLEYAEEHATRLGLKELRLYTNELMHENVAIYKKLGWEEYDRAEHEGFRRVFMRKMLSQTAA